jgi:hypothetical protein
MESLINEIQANQVAILSKVDFESISVYLFLKDQYEKGDIINNSLFQFVFRSYYRLDNAGLGDKIKKEYFKILAQKESSLERILLKLYDIPNSRGLNAVHFSFATKLLHTLDNNNPIFDAEVSDVIHKRRTGKTKEEKIKSCLNIYGYLEQVYSNMLGNNQIKEIIMKFRKKFNVSESEVSNIKVLDFIIWSLGKIKSKGSGTF